MQSVIDRTQHRARPPPESNGTRDGDVWRPFYATVDVGADTQPDVQEGLQIALGVAVVLASVIATVAIAAALVSVLRRNRRKLGDVEDDDAGRMSPVSPYDSSWQWLNSQPDALTLHSIDADARPSTDVSTSSLLSPRASAGAPPIRREGDTSRGRRHPNSIPVASHLSLNIPPVSSAMPHTSGHFSPLLPSQLSCPGARASAWTWPWSRRREEDHYEHIPSPVASPSSTTPSTSRPSAEGILWDAPESWLFPPPYHNVRPHAHDSPYSPGSDPISPNATASLLPHPQPLSPASQLSPRSRGEWSGDEDEIPLAERQRRLLGRATNVPGHGHLVARAQSLQASGLRVTLGPVVAAAGMSSCPRSPPPSYDDSVFV